MVGKHILYSWRYVLKKAIATFITGIGGMAGGIGATPIKVRSALFDYAGQNQMVFMGFVQKKLDISSSSLSVLFVI